MAGETRGIGRDLPLRAPVISFHGWDRGDSIFTKMALFNSFGLFFSNCNSCIGDFGPFKTLGILFVEGPQGIVPPPLE